MPLTTWSAGDLITAAKLNNDNTLTVTTDTARTVTVTHTWTASQTFTGGASFGAAVTTTTVTASGLITANAGATVASGQTLTVTGATITGLTAASVGAGTFPSGAFVFAGALSGITTLSASSTGTIGTFTTSTASATVLYAVSSSASNGANIRLGNTSGTAGFRDWGITTNFNTNGSLEFMYGGSPGATPIGGTVALKLGSDSSAVFAGAVSGVTTLAMGGALSGVTTMALSGTITSTKDGQQFTRSGASTGVQYFSLANTSGSFEAGVTSSIGAPLTGGLAYAAYMTTNSTQPLQLGTNYQPWLTVCATGAPTNATIGNLFIASTSAPSGNPSGGGFLWVEAGALKYRGSSGTITPIAAA